MLPREVALGRAGDYYIKGWDEGDQKRVENSTNSTTTTEISKDSAINSLNKGMEDLLK